MTAKPNLPRRRSLLQVTPPESWLADADVLECMTCARLFSLINRRHHCRSCGRIVCGPCSVHWLQLGADHFHHTKPVRVCVECHTASVMEGRGIFHADLMQALRVVSRMDNPTLGTKAKLIGEMRAIEAEIQSVSSATDLVTDDDAHECRIAQFNALGQRAAKVHDALTALRLREGVAVTCVQWTKDMTEIQPWHVRLALLTPATNNDASALTHEDTDSDTDTGNDTEREYCSDSETMSLPSLLALSSFLYPSPNVNLGEKGTVKHSPRTLRWHAVRTMDEVQSTRLVDVVVAGTPHRAMQITFRDPTSAANTTTTGNSAIDDASLVLVFIDDTCRSALDALYFYVFTEDRLPAETPSNGGREAEAKHEWRSDVDLNTCVHSQIKHRAETLTVQLHAIQSLEQAIQTRVSWDNSEHAALLERLYTALTPTPAAPFIGRRHKDWKRLGFQSEDPTTDFRGMGLLSLLCLVYAAENAQSAMWQLVSVQSTRPYPLAATAINIVSIVAESLGLASVKLGPAVQTKPNGQNIPSQHLSHSPLFRVFLRSPPASLPSVRSRASVHKHLEVLVCWLMLWLDAEAVSTQANYLSMGTVIRSLKDSLSAALAFEPATLEALVHAINAKHEVRNVVVPAENGTVESDNSEIASPASPSTESASPPREFSSPPPEPAQSAELTLPIDATDSRSPNTPAVKAAALLAVQPAPHPAVAKSAVIAPESSPSRLHADSSAATFATAVEGAGSCSGVPATEPLEETTSDLRSVSGQAEVCVSLNSSPAVSAADGPTAVAANMIANDLVHAIVERAADAAVNATTES